MNGVGFNLCLTFEEIKNIISYHKRVLNIVKVKNPNIIDYWVYQDRHPLQGERVLIFAYKKRSGGH